MSKFATIPSEYIRSPLVYRVWKSERLMCIGMTELLIEDIDKRIAS